MAKVTINQKALRDLEQKLSANVQVPLEGTESDAIAAVKRQYKQATGIDLPTQTARDLVRQARKS
ncbi:hypothetical protein [Nocardia sp. NPDC059195]|uniref:hypothetical protein n=1 Tax=Nocardia sp. NPDC059195 TaxID=3346765 RepID=UPI0036AB30CD